MSLQEIVGSLPISVGGGCESEIGEENDFMSFDEIEEVAWEKRVFSFGEGVFEDGLVNEGKTDIELSGERSDFELLGPFGEVGQAFYATAGVVDSDCSEIA